MKSIYYLSIIATILFAACSNEPDHIKLGFEYYNKGDYDRALVEINKAIELNPQDDKGYNDRAGIYAKLGDLEKAFADLDKAIELNPSSYPAYYNRGRFYLKKRNYKLAIDDFTKFAELDPENHKAYLYRASAYQLAGEYAKAIDDYNVTIRLNPSSIEAFNDRGFTYIKMGQFDKAKKDLIKALEINPDEPTPHMTMAELYSSTHNLEDACKHLNLAIDKGWDDWDYIENYKTLDNVRNASCYEDVMAKILIFKHNNQVQ
jgi:tetratricopeptide (TPR) repeat protein